MKIAVFGGSGKTGKVFVKMALAEGHELKLLLRNPDKLTEYREQLEILSGDVLDLDTVTKTIADTDAVVCLIGHGKDSPADLQVRAIQNIITSMKGQGIKRLFTLTGVGVYAKGDKPSILDKLFTFMVKKIIPVAYADGANHVKMVMTSELDWTVARGPVLTNQDRTNYKAGMVGSKGIGLLLSRAAISRFILDNLKDKTYYHKLPALSN